MSKEKYIKKEPFALSHVFISFDLRMYYERKTAIVVHLKLCMLNQNGQKLNTFENKTKDER